MSFSRAMIWLLSALLFFVCMSFFLVERGSDQMLLIAGMLLGISGVIAAAVMED